jgi:hypothetical protein
MNTTTAQTIHRPMIKSINQILVFILEVIILFSYGYFGMTRQWNLTLRVLFTILVVSIVVLLWSIFAAPKSAHRLQMPYLALFRAFIFSFSALLLFQSEHKNFAISIFVLTLLTQMISYFTE